MASAAPTPDYETPFTDASVVPGTLPGSPGYVPPGGALPAPSAPVVAPNGVGPLPPSAVPIVPPPEYGPPAPDPTDAIAAGLPPAQPGIPTRDQDQEIAPAVPREAPGNVGTPGAPNAQPADASPGTTGDVKDKLDAEAKARGETTEAQGRVGEDEQEKKDAQAQAATEAREEAQKHIATAQAIQDQYDQADKATQDQIGQMRAARQNFKLKDYWADKSGFQHAISALGVALGAFGSGLTKTPNYALQILDKKMDDDHRNQVDQLNKLSDDEMQARTGLQDSQKARALALANVDVGHADRLKLVAAKLEERSATADDLNYKNTLAAKAAELRQKAAESDTDATKGLRAMNLQDQAAQLAGRKEKSEEEYQRAQEEYLKEHGQYFANGGAKGRHGTGDGGGASRGAAAEELSKRIEAGKDGKPLSESEMIGAANELHVPLNGKAGVTTLDTIRKSVAFNANQGAKEQKAGNVDISAVDKRAKDVDRELNNPKGPGTQYDRLKAMGGVLKNAIEGGDRTAATSVLEEAGGMLSGGKSTRTTVELLHELKSTSDDLSSKWGKITGDPGESAAYTKRLSDLLGRVAVEKKNEIAEIRQRYVEQEMGEHGFSKGGPAKERVLGHMSMFGDANGSGGGGSAPQGRRVKLKDGRTGTLTSDGIFHQGQ